VRDSPRESPKEGQDRPAGPLGLAGRARDSPRGSPTPSGTGRGPGLPLVPEGERLDSPRGESDSFRNRKEARSSREGVLLPPNRPGEAWTTERESSDSLKGPDCPARAVRGLP
jgi:hypothetical protein